MVAGDVINRPGCIASLHDLGVPRHISVPTAKNGSSFTNVVANREIGQPMPQREEGKYWGRYRMQ
jgi:hypothetical protein